MNFKPALAIAVTMAAVSVSPPSASALDPNPEAVVDALQAVFGKHAKTRASGAKGMCVKGSFKPGADAAGLSKAPVFAKEVAVLGRFSMGGGNPKISDKTKPATRNFAFRLDPNGKNADLVMISAPMFFAKTPAQMLGFLEARKPGADGKPDAEKIKAFSAANPETTKQAAWLNGKPVPASFGGVNYWAAVAYTFTNAKGEAKVAKLKAVPAAGELGLTDDELKAKPDSFYADEMKERLAKGPVSFNLVAILGEAGDTTSDPTAMWPEESRKTVSLGTISITALEADAACDAGTFDPTQLPDGIAGPKDDPTFAVRSPAYAVSLSRRAN
jgi:catalase